MCPIRHLLKGNKMSTSDIPPETRSDYRPLIKVVENRVMTKVQILMVLLSLFWAFLIYVLYLRVKVTESFLEDSMKRNIRLAERIQVLEKSVHAVPTQPKCPLSE